MSLKDREWDCPSCNTKDIPRDLNAAINLQRESASSLGLADECGHGGFPHEQLVQEDTVRLFLHSKCCLTPESPHLQGG
ncbi:MAG: hypothetical protein QNJ32_10610 [Xenococcaceae cyanobacterium MO_167.B27]|nr:hypothetical protein [Xenococcaceae cyanobacterium MO_167.B27]